LGTWQKASEPYRYQGSAAIIMPLDPVQDTQPMYLAASDPEKQYRHFPS